MRGVIGAVLIAMLLGCESGIAPVLPDPSTMLEIDLLPRGGDSIQVAMVNNDTESWQVGRCVVWGQLLQDAVWHDDETLRAKDCPSQAAKVIAPGETWNITFGYEVQPFPAVARLRFLVAPQAGQVPPTQRYQALYSYSFTVN
jgi:hypothetical protein